WMRPFVQSSVPLLAPPVPPPVVEPPVPPPVVEPPLPEPVCPPVPIGRVVPLPPPQLAAMIAAVKPAATVTIARCLAAFLMTRVPFQEEGNFSQILQSDKQRGLLS